jgi:hypothetical protein
MENFTIHIFGYGETQINSTDLSIKVSTDKLDTVGPLVHAIFLNKPKDNDVSLMGFHAINIFGYNDVRWMSKGKDVKGFDVKDNQSLQSLIDNLIEELQSIHDAKLTTTTTTMVIE